MGTDTSAAAYVLAGVFVALIALACLVHLAWGRPVEEFDAFGDELDDDPDGLTDGLTADAPTPSATVPVPVPVLLLAGDGTPRLFGRALVGAPSIADLLAHDPQHLVADLRTRLVQFGLLAQDPDHPVDVARPAAQALARYLRMSVGEFVHDSWQGQPNVQVECLRTRGRGGVAQRVVVREHTLEAVQRSTVQVDVDGRRTVVLQVVLTVTLDVDSVAVDVADGTVVATGAGRASSRVELALAPPGAHPQTVMSRRTPTFSLLPHPP